MSELEKKKKLLLVEAEVYRELLKLEVQNLRIYGIKTTRRFKSLSPRSNPLIMMSLPILSSLFFRKRRSSLKKWGELALLGLQLWRRFGGILVGRLASSKCRPASTEAEDYLAKAM